WWKPFVTFIWYGGLLIALGGILAIAGRLQVDLRRRNAARLGADRREGLRALGEGPNAPPHAPEPAE
ncbi:MAG: hypothetical protein RIC51_09560, partial [Erythrobacter sp.]